MAWSSWLRFADVMSMRIFGAVAEVLVELVEVSLVSSASERTALRTAITRELERVPDVGAEVRVAERRASPS